MTVKVHYHISQDRAGLPQDYSGARHFVPCEGQSKSVELKPPEPPAFSPA